MMESPTTRERTVSPTCMKNMKDWPHGKIHMGEILVPPSVIVSSLSSTTAILVTGEIVLANDQLIKRKEHSVISRDK